MGEARETTGETSYGATRTAISAAPGAASRAPAGDEHALAGRTLADRYDLLALLGTGGMGAVYRARDRELDELVALKVIKAALARDPVMVDRFRHEVKLARRVTHRNVARTFELGHADGFMYCTMELVEGESLRARLARVGKLAIGDAAAIARELCEGLAAAHAADVIHRDIKPDNVLLAADGRVVLADFGVAAVVAGAATGELSGTPEYMAPEQARGEPPTPAVDVYSVGVLLFEMLTGLRAFTGGPATILTAKQERERLDTPPHSAPLDLAALIGRATARDPAARLPGAAELAGLLAPWARREDAPGAPARPGEAAPRRQVEAGELHAVVVLPPRGGGERMYVAVGVHEELLRRLVRRPRLRVLARGRAGDVPGAAVVELHAGELLAATIHHGGARTTLQLPLDIGSVGIAADAIASAVAEVTGQRSGGDDPAARGLELLLRARALAYRSFVDVPAAIELLEEAHALCPDDPRISALLAMACVRFVVVEPREGRLDFAGARALVRTALAAAPALSESHVAAGHLELHTGDPAVAAAHFRTAIACSPYVAEAHEGLGRMLLEAGFLEAAMPRLEDALAIAPNLSSVRWEIARAHALEQDWAAYDRLVEELAQESDRPMARLRCAWWRGDLGEVAALRGGESMLRRFEPGFAERMIGAILDGKWPEYRAAILGLARAEGSPSLRERAFFAQLAAEAAGFAGDTPACAEMVEHAVGLGLFDQHWLERCPHLEAARRGGGLAGARARVKRRAESILDALYGDGKALSDTLIA